MPFSFARRPCLPAAAPQRARSRISPFNALAACGSLWLAVGTTVGAAAGDDPKLASIAAADNDEAFSPDDQFTIAERWWQYAEKNPDATERIACQLRARDGMIRTRPRMTDRQRALIDQRLKQLPLFPEK